MSVTRGLYREWIRGQGNGPPRMAFLCFLDRSTGQGALIEDIVSEAGSFVARWSQHECWIFFGWYREANKSALSIREVVIEFAHHGLSVLLDEIGARHCPLRPRKMKFTYLERHLTKVETYRGASSEWLTLFDELSKWLLVRRYEFWAWCDWESAEKSELGDPLDVAKFIR